jgi:hypothetical protein
MRQQNLRTLKSCSKNLLLLRSTLLSVALTRRRSLPTCNIFNITHSMNQTVSIFATSLNCFVKITEWPSWLEYWTKQSGFRMLFIKKTKPDHLMKRTGIQTLSWKPTIGLLDTFSRNQMFTYMHSGDLNLNTVTSPVFEWSFSGHNLFSIIEWWVIFYFWYSFQMVA